MQDNVFLDTNILVYLSNEDSSFHQDATRKRNKPIFIELNDSRHEKKNRPLFIF